MHRDGLVAQAREAADEGVDVFLRRSLVDQRLHALLEGLRQFALDEDLGAGLLVDDLVATARLRGAVLPRGDLERDDHEVV